MQLFADTSIQMVMKSLSSIFSNAGDARHIDKHSIAHILKSFIAASIPWYLCQAALTQLYVPDASYWYTRTQFT